MGSAPPPALYARRRPEESTLHKVVQDNLATLYEAVDEGALPIAVRRIECFLKKRGLLRDGDNAAHDHATEPDGDTRSSHWKNFSYPPSAA